MSVTIGNITKRIKSNKQNIKVSLNVNSEFEQSDIIQKRVKQNLDKIEKQDNVELEQGDIIYNENEVINIPKKLDNLFDNLLCDNYYLYGISISPNSFLQSLLYIILSDFKFKSQLEQSKFATQLSEKLVNDISDYFKTKKYSALNYKKIEMIENIENNVWTNAEIHYLSDYYNINLILLDYYKFTYYCGDNYNEANNNVIIIKYNDIYLPFIHIFGENPSNLIYKCIINKLKINNLSIVKPEILKKDSLKASKELLTPASFEKKNTNLKALSSYKLTDLQELATQQNIDIKCGSKKKTKKQLYDELS